MLSRREGEVMTLRGWGLSARQNREGGGVRSLVLIVQTGPSARGDNWCARARPVERELWETISGADPHRI